MTVTEEIDRKHQEDLQRLRGFRLLDDDFFTKCFEGDTECIELILQIVLAKGCRCPYTGICGEFIEPFCKVGCISNE